MVVSGTSRDSIFVLEGLLEQQTGLSPVEIMIDTVGDSDIIFDLFWLLGYQFTPGLSTPVKRYSGGWMNRQINYGSLDELACGCAELLKAEDQWDEMMRTAGSLKLDTIHASELICSLLKNSRPSGLARAICCGQRGKTIKRYRAGQEDQLGALGLVINAVVQWKTLYMHEALSWMRSNGEEIGVEDIARLSPQMHGHINMLGHYTFTLSENILKGEMRVLNSI